MTRRKEFESAQIGPEDARRASFGLDYFKERNRAPQGRLFDTNEVPLAEPHQQTAQQFANDPRSWFHGRFQHPALRGMHVDSTEMRRSGNEGVHFGTRQAAVERLTAQGTPREVPHPHTGEDRATAVSRVFAVRHAGRTANEPKRAIPDQWSDWYKMPEDVGEYYRNEVEDIGSISIRVPGMHHVVSHRQFVQQAVKQGKNVHPIIKAEAEHLPEYAASGVTPQEEEHAAHQASIRSQWEGGQRLFRPNDVEWPAAGEHRRKALLEEHLLDKQAQFKKKNPALSSELDKFGKLLGD
ncbi:MAG TPA: hypothetical protein VFI41_05075 [Gemmatimonadales bacterium]|nr:hypothetical protein [Gemmatimonadales bacterium]